MLYFLLVVIGSYIFAFVCGLLVGRKQGKAAAHHQMEEDEQKWFDEVLGDLHLLPYYKEE